MKVKPYPKTKPSGIEWLGNVPEHWEVKRLKDVGTLRGGAGFPHEEQDVEDEELPFYKVGDLKASLDGRVMGSPEHTISKETAKKLRAAIIPPDSIVYAKIGAALLLNRRRVTFVHCCIDNNMTAYLPDKRSVRGEWAFYWLSTLDFGEFMNPGAVPSFSEGYQSILPVLVPPLHEQSAIAAFLDRETGRINELVGKKKELIERLKEKRSALISRTVTRGLPAGTATQYPQIAEMYAEEVQKSKDLRPSAKSADQLPENPPLKPSGIDWLGDVPAQWEVKSLTRVTLSIRNGTSATQLEDEVENAVPVTRIESISGGKINFDKVGLVEWTRSLESYQLNYGDILMSHINSLSMVGNCAIYDSDKPLFSGMNLLRIQPEPSVNPHWLWRVLSCDGIRKEISARAKPAINQASVTTNQIKSLSLPIPPLPEQRAIAAYLDAETTKIDAFVAKVETAIERLQEFRSALITAAVTGKIDVREEAVA